VFGLVILAVNEAVDHFVVGQPIDDTGGMWVLAPGVLLSQAVLEVAVAAMHKELHAFVAELDFFTAVYQFQEDPEA